MCCNLATTKPKPNTCLSFLKYSKTAHHNDAAWCGYQQWQERHVACSTFKRFNKKSHITCEISDFDTLFQTFLDLKETLLLCQSVLCSRPFKNLGHQPRSSQFAWDSIECPLWSGSGLPFASPASSVLRLLWLVANPGMEATLPWDSDLNIFAQDKSLNMGGSLIERN